MLKVLSKAGLTLALAGSVVLTGFQLDESPSVETSKYDLSLAKYVAPTPELADKAKELGFDVSKVNPAEKIANHGTKFQQPGDNHVASKKPQGIFQFWLF